MERCANLGEIEAGTYKQGARSYDIVVKLAEKQGKDQVAQFLFPGTEGHPVLLASLTTTEEGEMPIQITRKDKRRVSKLFAQLDKGLAEAGTVAMILVVLTLAAILESFRQPALILITVPLALIGTIWALALFGQNFSIFVIMGVVMMIGIVVNNAILIMPILYDLFTKRGGSLFLAEDCRALWRLSAVRFARTWTRISISCRR